MRAQWVVGASDAYGSDWVHDAANEVTVTPVEPETVLLGQPLVTLEFPVDEAEFDTGTAFLTLKSGLVVTIETASTSDSVSLV